MKRLILFVALAGLCAGRADAQIIPVGLYFMGDCELVGNQLVFKISPSQTCQTRLTDLEYFIRWDESYGNDMVFSAATVNLDKFPTVDINQVRDDVIDPGYHNHHFIFAVGLTPFIDMNVGEWYEVFRVTVSNFIPGVIQLVMDNDNPYPYYFAVLGDPHEMSPFHPNVPWNNPTGSSVSFYYKNINLRILPIELQSFTGKLVDCNASLQWTTATESNGSHFEVQHSTDGTNFTPVATVPAIGNSTTEYTYHQDVAVTGKVNYYRLKIVSNDNGEKFSKTITINAAHCDDFIPLQVQIHPNPISTNTMQMTVTTNDKELLEIQLVDLWGKSIKTYKQQVVRGENKLSLPLPGTANGTFMVKVISGKRTVIKKVLIER